ncbi:peptidoglycan-N-acetylglucosamine deacetylase [Gammaproteobacteria bacterium]
MMVGLALHWAVRWRTMVLGMLAFLGGVTPLMADEGPTTVVERFYQALQVKNCAEAIRLRPGYRENQCQKVSEVGKPEVTVQHSGNRVTVMRLRVGYRLDGVPNTFNGYVTALERKSGVWTIAEGSFRETSNLEAYLRSPEFIRLRTFTNQTIGTLPPPALVPTPATSTVAEARQTLRLPPSSAVIAANGTAGPTSTRLPSVAGKPTPVPTYRRPPARDLTNEVEPSQDPALDLESAPAFHSPPASEPRTGADSLLAACWGPGELRGTIEDRKVFLNLTATHTPPARTQPRQSSPPLPESFARSIRYVIPKRGEKLIALTFDLCEKATEVTGYDAALINILRAQSVKATFFAGGKWLRTHSEKAMQLIADPLFEIGNHAWTHGNLRVLRGQELLDQIRWTQAQYELLRERLLALPCAASAAPSVIASIPEIPAVFRFPYGACDASALDAVTKAGLYPIQWDVVAGDPSRDQTAGRIIHTILSQIHPGAIIVAHANGRGWHTAEALSTLIPELRARGYRFVTVSELLSAGQPAAVESCYENRPGDTLRYDQMFGRGTE